MGSKLKQEIKQSSDFVSVEEEAMLNIVRTAGHIGAKLAELLKPYGLTATQYNALRILRGARPKGLMCGEIGDRMLTRESDITRLLDRLETQRLISRVRPPENRRAVIATITPEGEKLLAQLDEPIAEGNRAAAAGLSQMQLRELIDLLEALRSA